MTRKYRAIIFDLDGTLIDTIGDIAASANYALSQMGRETQSLEYFRQRVGWGLRVLMEKSLAGEPEETIDQAFGLLQDYYGKNPCSYTKAYPGIDAMLEQVASFGIDLYVYTNKAEPIAKDVVETLFGSSRFKDVFGAVPERPLKPRKEGIRFVIDATGYEPGQLLYAGDSEVDMETAEAGGLDALAVTWGFRSEKELRDYPKLCFVRDPAEISSIILKDGIADPIGSLL